MLQIQHLQYISQPIKSKTNPYEMQEQPPINSAQSPTPIDYILKHLNPFSISLPFASLFTSPSAAPSDYLISSPEYTSSPSYTSSRECTAIKYIDCRNWAQFGEQMLTSILTLILLLHIIKHYRNLLKQKQQNSTSEYQKSIRRKIRVNLIQILYLSTLLFNTLYDIVLYFWYRSERDTITDYNLDNWYKITQFLYVNLLNTLNLTVGFLYWKATRAYYVLSDLQVPPIYHRFVKIGFFIMFSLNAIAVGAVVVLEIVGVRGHDIGVSLSAFTLLSTTTSILCCIGCRLLYSKYILTKIDLSPSAQQKQKVTSLLLLLSSILRITMYIIDLAIPDWSSSLRNQQLDQDNMCMDTQLYYCFILLSINLLINLMPAVIYGHLFVSEVKLGVMKDQRQHRRKRTGSKGSGDGTADGDTDRGAIRRRLFSD